MRRLILVLLSILSLGSLNLFSQTTSCFTISPIVNATCPGLKTGSISLNISGGSGSYIILFNGSSISTTTISNLSAGTYTINITDTKNVNCVRSLSLNVTNYLVPTVTIAGNSSYCPGQNIILSATLDKFYSTSYSYNWSNGSTGTPINFVPTSSGFYSVTVTDAAGCSVSASKVISQSAGPNVSFSGTYTNCPGKAVTLVPIINGGVPPYTYTWDGISSSTSSKTVNPTTPQTYCLTVKDANNCTGSSCVIVNQKYLNVTLPTGISVCQGENYNLIPVVSNFSGALSYQWSNGGTASTNLITVNGTQSHSLTVTDGTGCSGSSITSIGMVSNPVINLPSSIEICQSNSVTLDTKLSTTSHTFRWSTGSTAPSITLNPTNSSIISVTVTNTNKCQSLASVSINVKSNPVISLPTSQLTCANIPFTLSPVVSGGTPGYNYLWSNGSTSTILTTAFSTPGSLSLKVTDQNGCNTNWTTAINVRNSPTVNISGNTLTCPGQTTVLNSLTSGGTSPYSYKWSNGENTQNLSVTPSSVTVYTITVTDNLGCTNSSNITVSPTKSIAVTLPASNNICLGDSITLKPVLGVYSGDVNYVWSNNQSTSTINVKPINLSKFSLTVKDNLGCSGFAETIVNVNNLPEAILPDVIAGCFMDSVSVRLNNTKGALPFRLKWSNGSSMEQTNYFVDAEKPIFVIITDVNNCKTTLYSKIKTNEKPVLKLNNQYTFCGNEPIKINPVISGGLAPYTYLWSNGSTVAELNAVFKENTNLSLRISDANDCKDIKSTSITINNDIPIIMMPDTLRSCVGQDLLISPNVQDKIGIKSYIWSDGQTKSSIIKKVLNPVTMRLQVINLIGCMAVDSLFILPYNNPSIVLPESFESCKSSKISIEIPNLNDKNTTYQWSTGEISNKIELLADADKQIKVWAKNTDGCKDSATTFLKVFNNPLVNILGKSENCSKTPSSYFADISSGNAPFTIKWASGETTNKVDYPAVDSIQKVGVEITDIKGCKTFSTLSLTLLKSPEIQFPNELYVCENEEKSLNPIVTFGKKPYLYQWNSGETSSGIMGKPGNYLFQVSDANGCTSRKNVTLFPLKIPELYVSYLKQPSCNLPNGQIKIEIKNNTSTEVLWSNGNKGTLLDFAYPGKYTAAAIDSNNCLGEITQNLICNCENKVGIMDPNLVSICKNEIRQAKYDASNQLIGVNNSRFFIMHNSPGINLGNQIIYQDTTNMIKYASGMAVGETYYLSVVIGRRLSNGSLDLNDPCLTISIGTPVKILSTPEMPIKIAVSDTLVCPGSSITLQTNKQENGFVYKWQTPRGNINTLTPTLTIPKFENKDIGQYFVSIGGEKCNSNSFGPIAINFSKEINEIFTEPDKTVCGIDSVQINANMPANATGKWLTGSSALVNKPDEENTWVNRLMPGKNEFLWTVITRNCIITDTLNVYAVPQPKLNNDTVNLDDTKNTALFDFLENDDLSNIPPSFLRINLISKPLSGNLSINKEGFFTYSRDPNISEDQSFAFVYEVCNTDTTGNCTNNCNLAEVILNVTFNPRTLIYPTIGLRPKFNNPVWKFEAARPMYNAHLSIFDRWGKIVFKEDFLQLQKGEIVGSWNGLTQNQVKLPAGAYYFSLIGEIENKEKVVQNGIIYLLE